MYRPEENKEETTMNDILKRFVEDIHGVLSLTGPITVISGEVNCFAVQFANILLRLFTLEPSEIRDLKFTISIRHQSD